MDAEPFDEQAFFAAIADSGARALLIGRRALIALGIPVLTADYDLWIHIDDIEKLNRALEPLAFVASRPADEARKRGRYVLENSEHVDVLVARSHPTVDGEQLDFDAAWTRRQSMVVAAGVTLALPSTADLILTKRFGARPKDAEDIRMLEELLRGTDD